MTVSPAEPDGTGDDAGHRAPEPPRSPPADRAPHFVTTHWSLVLAAGGASSVVARDALGRLLETYWYPLYAFVRRKGHAHEDACDLTQEFVARLLERDSLRAADPAKGRFRTFLLAALERFLIDEWRRVGREKRGGRRTHLSLSLSSADGRYRLDSADSATPERLYERQWALALLAGALQRLEEESAASGRAAVFAAVRPVLTGEDSSVTYAPIASSLGMTDGALRTLVHRLRARFRTILRAAIAETVSTPDELDDEIRHLFRCLA